MYFLGRNLSFIVAKGCRYVVKNFFTEDKVLLKNIQIIPPRTEAHEQWVKP